MGIQKQDIAEMSQTKQEQKSPKTHESDNRKKKGSGILFGFFAFLTAIAIMVAVFGGAFYFMVKSNIGGIADRYRNQIKGIPVISWALPKVPDPEDPKLLTEEQIRAKYTELLDTSKDLSRQLSDANSKIKDLQKYKDEVDKIKAESDKVKKDAQAQQAQVDQQKKLLAEDKKKVDELVAKGDTAGFKQFFEKIDKDTAQKLYAEILGDQKVSADTRKMYTIYETMEPSATAKVLTQMGTAKINEITDIIKNINKDVAAQVLALLDTTLASRITDKLYGK